jgi:hypothetical protein
MGMVFLIVNYTSYSDIHLRQLIDKAHTFPIINETTVDVSSLYFESEVQIKEPCEY